MRLVSACCVFAASTLIVFAQSGKGAGDARWETAFRSLPQPDSMRQYMIRLSARPHHLGSAYDKSNAEWILSKFKEWGLDAHIETFEVLFPTPQERVLELIAPRKYRARLYEPALAADPTSGQQDEQLPSYNAYSVDGDVTAPLVYVNYGIPDDYETLKRLGVTVKGKIVNDLQCVLGADMEIKLVISAAIPTAPSGKFRYVVSNIVPSHPSA